MIRQKKEIKRGIIVVIFISFILMTNVVFLNHSPLKEKELIDNKELDRFPNPSISNIDDYILGTGDDQDVRIYVTNESSNFDDNEDYFKIPSIPTDEMFLSYGDFNFTFQNNFTTDHVLEDKSALDAIDSIEFNFDETQPNSNINYGNGTSVITGTFSNLVDGLNSSSLWLQSGSSGVINFTIKANYNGETFSNPVIDGVVEFNRNYILALILSLLFDISLDANLTIRIKNYLTTEWINLTDPIPINSSIGIQEIKRKIINENLNFIDLSDICYIQFYFKRDDKASFNGYFYNLELPSIYAFDLSITNNTYVALEFDLRGEQSNVNGFYAWIRTLNETEAATTELNITIYRASDTIVRTESNLQSIKLTPNYNDMIYSKIFVNYTNDNVSYFEFNSASTQNMNLSNYFIVIKSNNSNNVYSLVTLPHYDFTADGTTDHQLLTTSNNGASWSLAKKLVVATLSTYTSGQLDASPFKLNVTRGYMPSDFEYDGQNTLKIQDKIIEDLEIKTYPYNESSYLTWGKGRWNNVFSPVIENNSANEFEIYLEWNESIVEGFKFNISSYSINAYWIEGSTSYFNATYNEDPEWVLEYDYNDNNSKFTNWDLLEFWFIYPNYMSAHNLTNPNDEEILWLLDEESVVTEYPDKLKIVINKSYTNPDGIFLLNLTSYNFIHQMHSFINYKGILTETNGFMYGDNISVRLDIQDHNFNAPLSGEANVTLFYPNGTRYIGAEMTNATGFIENSVLSYDFNNNTILDLTDAVTVFGRYQLGFFWSNGSAIGCNKITVYIDSYDLDLYDLAYSPNLGTNILTGELNNKVFQNYNMLIASINETTLDPNFYAVNESEVNQEYSYNLGGQDLTINIESFLQSENILNPNETVNLKTTIQNIHPFIPFDVKIDTKLVSYINEDWIIAENNSNIINLNSSGSENDTFIFDLDLTIPSIDIATSIWQGVNAPIRLGGAKTIVTVYIEGVVAGIYNSPQISLLSNKTSENYDGHILGLRISEEITSRTILYEFERDECLYFPDNSSFLVNIIDSNYVSSYRQFDNEFSINLNSKFTKITIEPELPIKGQSINFSSTLTTEFDDALSNKNVSCDYFDSGYWVEINTQITDVNGRVSFIIDSLAIDFEGDLLIKLAWEGDIVNGVSKNVSIVIIHENNDISIVVNPNDVLIYKNRLTLLTCILTNTGDSNLRILDIDVDIVGNLQYSIVEVNHVELNWFSSGDHTEIAIEIQITEISQLQLNFTITAQNVITGENITFSQEVYYNIFDPPITDYFVDFFMFIMIAIFVVVWAISILYARRVRRKIEEPVEEPLRRPRKGRYLMVSDLKKPTTEKKVIKKKSTQKEVKTKKTTDLDSLLEERGLADNQKKKESKE